MRINLIDNQDSRLTLPKTRLIARLKADGSIFVGGKRKTNYFLKYESNNPEELERFTNDLKQVYGLEPKFEMHRSGKKPNKFLKQVYIRSKLAFEDMQKYGPFYSKTWRIPKEIKEGPREIKIEFIRIFAEDEGSVIVGKNEIRIYSINKCGLQEISELLKNFKIKTTIKNGFGEKRNVFAIIIKDIESLLLFKKLIGFYSLKKNQKLNELISRKFIWP